MATRPVVAAVPVPTEGADMTYSQNALLTASLTVNAGVALPVAIRYVISWRRTRRLKAAWLQKSGEQYTIIPLPSRCTCCPEHGHATRSADQQISHSGEDPPGGQT